MEVAGKTGSAQVVAKARLERSPNDAGDPAARLVRLLRAGRPPDDRDGGAGRARRQRRRGGGARGAADPRRVVRPHAGRRPRRPRSRPPPSRPGRRTDVAIGIDRRLVYNVDWVLLGASLLLALIGVSMVFSATHSGRTPDLYLKQLAAGGRRDRGARGDGLDRLPAARRPRDAALRRLGPGARLRAEVRAGDRGHAPLAADRRLPAAAVRAREDRGGDLRRQGLLRVPAGGARPARHRRAGRGRRPAGAPDREGAGPRHGRLPDAAAARGGLPGGAAHARGGRRGDRPGAGGRARLAVPQGLPEDAHLHVPRPVARPARRRLPEDPVADRGGLGRARGQGLHGGQPGPARLPARRGTPTSSSPCWRRRRASSAS